MAARAALLFALTLWGCSGEEAPPPVPVPAPAPHEARDTGTPKPTEDPEAKARREYFEKLAKGEPVPEPVAAVQPAPVAPAPAPVAPAPKPAPAPVAAAPVPPKPKPAPAPVAPAPLPKPTTTPNGAAAVAATAAVRPAPAPAPTPVPVPAPAPEPVAMVHVEPQPVMPEPVVPEPATARRYDPLSRCGDPAAIEAMAARGALSNADIACVDAAFAAAENPLDRERISFLAITNAYASNDELAQEESLRRHLTEVDGWNPEIAWRYALLLYQKGGAPAEIVKWSDTALEHRTGWSHDVYDQRVYSAYKLRAAASQGLLQRAEDEYGADPSEENNRALITAREDTKQAAREWYAFARDTGQETKAAYDLCLIASQSQSYCDGT